MKSIGTITLLVGLLSISTSLAQIPSYENADGSYSVVDSSDQEPSNTGAAVYNLITKQSGWTEHSNPEQGVNVNVGLDGLGAASGAINLIGNTVRVAAQIPYVEILRLIESFLKVKGQIVGNFYILWQDNAHIIKALTNTFLANIPKLHNFTLNSIVILRKVFEFVGGLLGNINVNINKEQWTSQ